jgi:HlyD family secretion protein
LEVAKAAVEQTAANLQNSKQNLDYTNIRSPVDGIVIDRKIEPGQSLAAAFQTPELFVVAPDMEKRMHVFASVDEADIGLIRDAMSRGQPVHFTVDAYPDDLFEGTIEQIRFSSEETENVVTYPVVVAAPNPDLKLLPGMTAKISFQVDKKSDILMIPNAALRFYPKIEHVRPEDRKLLDGADVSMDDDEASDSELSALEQAEAGRNRNRRHVWIEEGKLLKAVEIVTGLMNNKFTELLSGDIKEGQPLVTGIKPKEPYGG